MEFFKHNTNFNFMGLRYWTVGIAILLCLISGIILGVKGLNFGLEFTGGLQMEVQFPEPVDLKQIEVLLKKVDNKYHRVKLQYYGNTRDILIRIANDDIKNQNQSTISLEIISALNQAKLNPEIRLVEYIGSEVGSELAEKGGIAVVLAILSIMIYIAVRFEYRFAIAAALALCHDAILVLGIFSLLQINFDLSALAAILAMIGYSLNDTVVVFDRVRENFRHYRKVHSGSGVINLSINQTLSRTIMTSLLTLFVVLPLLIFGGESLFSFALILFLGIIIGTYSSIFVASSIALFMGLSRTNLLANNTVIDAE